MVAKGGNDSYILADQDGMTLGKQCNSFQLKRHYVELPFTFNEKVRIVFQFSRKSRVSQIAYIEPMP